MPRSRRKTKLRPKTPSRIKKRKARTRKPRGLQHPELWGLGLVALGLFLGSVVYVGWNGGYVGGAMADGLDALIGGASWVIPVALVAIGGLMVMRSALVEVRPFRTGLAVVSFGLMVTLGKDQGGYLGQLLGGAIGVAIGATGSTILGIFALLVGALLLSGASLGAILRRSGHAVHTQAKRVRERPAVVAEAPPRSKPAKHGPPVDAEERYPDVVGEPPPLIAALPEPAPLVAEPELADDQESLFDVR